MLKDIEGYPGYKASIDGKIISFKSGKPKELKTYVKTYGYLYVVLSKNGKKHYLRLHRVIAKTFIPNPKGLPEVNHKDEDKTNNRVDNLEWCTPHDNRIYGTRRERVARKVSDPSKQRKNNTSGRKGVTKTRWNTWVVCFNRKYLGTFKTFDEAVKVREKAEKEAYNFTKVTEIE